MPHFRKTQIALLFGLAAGFVAAAGVPAANAVHITLRPDPPNNSGIAEIGEPVVIFGTVERGEVPPGGSFTHTYTFGFDIDPHTSGTGGVSLTPNFLRIGMVTFAGFADFDAEVMGPGVSEVLLPDEGVAEETPRINRRSAEFAAIDTGTETPYTLTINGTLLPGVEVGNYTGNIAVTPLPGAALLFLSALGGLVVVRRYRRQDAAAA